MDIRVPPSLHLSTLITPVLDWKNPGLVRHVDANRYRISCLIILRPVVSLSHEYSLHRQPTFCRSTIFRNAGEHLRRAWSGTPARRVRFVCDEVRVGSSYIWCRVVDEPARTSSQTKRTR